MRGVEVFLVPDVARKLLRPLLPQALVMISDDEPALRLAVAVAVTVLIGDNGGGRGTPPPRVTRRSGSRGRASGTRVTMLPRRMRARPTLT
jgi:hypothetical protein